MSPRKFIGMSSRSAAKPACISAQTERAKARASRASGHSPASGKSSARYSTIARVSQTVRSPCSRTGTLPAGLTARSRARQSS